MVVLGTHYLLTVAPSARARIREFYVRLLGCRLVGSDGETTGIPEAVDLFAFPGDEVIGIQYLDNTTAVPTTAEHRRGAWMELATDDVEGLRRQLIDFGVEEITDFWDSDHFYFHAPGGQVFRLLHSEAG